MQLSEKITQLRKNKKITQKELALKLNVTDKTVSRWETGNALPDIEMMKKISNVFGISISELYDCVGNECDDKKENFEENIVNKYIKYNIVANALLMISPFLLLFVKLYGSLDNALLIDVKNVVNTIFCLTALAFFLIALIMSVIQFVKLYNYREKYKKILIKYSVIFLLILVCSIISDILIFIY